MMTTNDSILAWHFLALDRYTRRGYGFPPPVLVKVGQTLTECRPLKICKVGLHASVRALDALQYAPGPIVCRVRMEGDILHATDKLCASHRTVLAMEDATAVLHEFACWCAEKALIAEWDAGRKPDSRSWVAVDAKRAWMRGEIDDEELYTANANADIQQVSYRNPERHHNAATAAYWASFRNPTVGAVCAANTAVADDEANAELEKRLGV